jgi:hypothetical protein
MGLIAKHVDAEILRELKTCGTAVKMMETAFNELISNSFNMKRIQIRQIVKDPLPGGTEADINKWISTKTDIFHRLGEYRIPLSDQLLCLCGIGGLPSEFDQYVRDYWTRQNLEIKEIKAAIK